VIFVGLAWCAAIDLASAVGIIRRVTEGQLGPGDRKVARPLIEEPHKLVIRVASVRRAGLADNLDMPVGPIDLDAPSI